MTNEEVLQKMREQQEEKRRDAIVPGHPKYRSAEAEMPKLSEATAAKYSKTPVFLGAIGRFPLALQEIAKVSKFGCEKHKVPLGDMSYLTLPDADTMYLEAESRHMLHEQIEGAINQADGNLYHKAQKAWNALADLEVFLRRVL